MVIGSHIGKNLEFAFGLRGERGLAGSIGSGRWSGDIRSETIS